MLLFIWFLSTAMTCTTKLSGREVAINLIGILFACFVHKQHIFSDVNWRIWHRLILISYLMFGAFIWAASKLTISFHCSLLVRKLPAKAMISVYIFVVVFKSEGWEPGQGDKISEIDMLFVLQPPPPPLLHTRTHTATAVYSVWYKVCMFTMITP